MARCFNRAWDLLDRSKRTPAEDREMLVLSHSARYHAGAGGTARNRAIGDWQISRVYAAIGDAPLSLRFAEAALEECETHELVGLVGSAHEGLARAFAMANDLVSARRHLERATELVREAPLDREGRSIFLSQIRETGRLVARRARQARI